MKKLLLLYLVLTGVFTFAQQRGADIIINWGPTVLIPFGETKIKLPQFDRENFQFKGETGQLLFYKKIPQATAIDEKSLKITNVVFEPVTDSELGSLKVSAIPDKINASIYNLVGRDKRSALLTFFPIIKDGSGYKKVKSLTYNFLPDLTASRAAGPGTVNVISNSVLATGEWYRFYVIKSGGYLINKSFLQGLGINMSGVDPRKIKIYGNGGRMVPLRNSIFYPEDLAENAIQVTGESDGVFNDTDAVLFYAEGVDNWNGESDTTNNLYADKSYYYVNVQGDFGKRVPQMIQPGTPTISITTFDDYQYHELDQINIGRLGRRWFGEEFDVNNVQEFPFIIPNIITTEPVSLKVYTAAASPVETTFKVEANNLLAGTITVASLGEYHSAEPCIIGQFGNAVPVFPIAASENITVKLTYNNSGVPSSKGYLDYILL